MYALMRQSHPPTVIEHSVTCRFLTKNEDNLIVAGTSLLQVYKLAQPVDNDDKQDTGQQGTTKKLQLLCQFQLYGTVCDMQVVQLGRAGRDSLLLAFEEAKLSLVEYDPFTHDLKTVAIRYFELDEYKCGQHSFIRSSMLRVDPDQRCAVMLVYDMYLIVIPLRHDSAGITDDQQRRGDRSPLLPHYSIRLRDLDNKLRNIADIQFLHGYNEPTLFVLYEPLPTWVGRAAIRQDTKALLAISLSVGERIHPVIWSMTSLPYDCFRALPVPKPIGGVVVFAVNSLLYLNQSVPPFGVSVNSITDLSTEFPLREQAGVCIALDCSQACFISSDRLVLSLGGGDIYVVTLVVDSMRMVRSFNFERAAASVLTCCICTLPGNYLFLGSRLGNSLLLHYTEKATIVQSAGASTSMSAVTEPAAKKRRTSSFDWLASALDDEDELEVYGQDDKTDIQLASYSFEVCDSIINIGPLNSTGMGEPSLLSDEFCGEENPELELVSCSGSGKNGSLSVLQRNIRPQLVTTFQLVGCTDMWTVFSHDEACTESESTYDEATDTRHAFLILSQADHTMVLRTGQEILELDHSGFGTAAPTIFATNIGSSNHILQVSPQGVRLLAGVNQLQYLTIEAGTQITACSVAGSYVALSCTDGTIRLVTFKEGEGSDGKLTIETADIGKGSLPVTCSLYEDKSGMFTTHSVQEQQIFPPTPFLEERSPMPKIKQEPIVSMTTLSGLTTEEEDEMLYGDASSAFFPTPSEVVPKREPQVFSSTPTVVGSKPWAQASAASSTVPDEDGIDWTEHPSYWLFVCKDNGFLEVYHLPDFQLVFSMRNFPVGPRILLDSDSGPGLSGFSEQRGDASQVLELLMVGLGPGDCQPYLMARTGGRLLIYEAFSFPHAHATRRLNVRFRKVQHNLLLVTPQQQKQTASGDLPNKTQLPKSPQLRVFRSISLYSGVFVCGPCPYWIFMTQRGALRMHPMMIDGRVSSFAPFNNVNCPRGFLYFNGMSELRIAVLPTHLTLDAPWPVRKIPLRCSPRFVSFHPESKTYCVVTSTRLQHRYAPRKTNDDTSEREILDKDGERFIYPSTERYQLQLYSPATWETVPNTLVQLDEFEWVTSLKVVRLKSEETADGLKCYVAVATCSVLGEEVTSRGKIMIFDIADVVPEPGKPLTKHKLKTLYNKEQKGPVSALAQTNGHLLGAVGQKIYIWSFVGQKDLVGVAFIDTQMYIHSIATIKDFILVTDIQKSITVMRFQLENRCLSVVSKDYRYLEIYASEFVVEKERLAFVVTDRDSNLIIYEYQPEVLESQGGQRLLRRGDIHLGTRCNSLWRTTLRVPTSLSHGRLFAGLLSRQDKRHITWFSGVDGSIGFILPVAEKTYRRLLLLQNRLLTSLPHYAGLNPKAHRLLQSSQLQQENPHRNILDGELLSRYVHLSKTEQQELARALGTTSTSILDDLDHVEYCSSVF